MNGRHQIGSFTVQLESGERLRISEAAMRACQNVTVAGGIGEVLSEEEFADSRFVRVSATPEYEIEVTMKFRLHPKGFKAALNSGNIEIFLAQEREPANCGGSEITT